jgi:hypothetical protein
VPFEDVDSFAHHEYIISAVANALESASKLSYRLAVVLSFANTITNDSS